LALMKKKIRKEKIISRKLKLHIKYNSLVCFCKSLFYQFR
jgi:hypothetical protein